MPTVARIGPFRLFFYAGDLHEPVHVHEERDDKVAKFWLDPVPLARSGGFSRPELPRIQAVVRENEDRIIEEWNAYFCN